MARWARCSNPYPVGHHRDYHVSLTLDSRCSHSTHSYSKSNHMELRVETYNNICTSELLSDDTHDCHWQELPNLLGLMVQSVSASVTDTKFRLGELGVGSNPCPVGHHRDHHVPLKLDICLHISNFYFSIFLFFLYRFYIYIYFDVF